MMTWEMAGAILCKTAEPNALGHTSSVSRYSGDSVMGWSCDRSPYPVCIRIFGILEFSGFCMDACLLNPANPLIL